MTLIYMECTLQHMFNSGQPEEVNTILKTFEPYITEKLSYVKTMQANV